MIRVQGFFRNPVSGVYVKDPVLLIDFHGAARGALVSDVNVCEDKEESYVQCGAFPFTKEREVMTYNSAIADPYDQILDAIQKAVIDEIKADPHNQDCILTAE